MGTKASATLCSPNPSRETEPTLAENTASTFPTAESRSSPILLDPRATTRLSPTRVRQSSPRSLLLDTRLPLWSRSHLPLWLRLPLLLPLLQLSRPLLPPCPCCPPCPSGPPCPCSTPCPSCPPRPCGPPRSRSSRPCGAHPHLCHLRLPRLSCEPGLQPEEIRLHCGGN